jgi:hypothetical protein
MFGKPITSVAAILLSTALAVAPAAAQPAPSETDAGHARYPKALPIQKYHPRLPGSHPGVPPIATHERPGFGRPGAGARAHPLSDASRDKAQADSVDIDDSVPPPPPSDGPH